jgi:hypothetical protein
MVRSVIALVLVIATAGCDPDRSHSSPSWSTETVRLVAAPVPGPLQQYNIPDLAVRALPESRDFYQYVSTDGRRLYAERKVRDRKTHLVRFNPATGEVVAEYRYRKLPRRTPYNPGGDWVTTSSGVVVLDGDRKTVAVLDPETLAVRRRVRLPRNTRSELPSHHQNQGPIWVGHKSFDYDSFRERYTRRATTRIDTAKLRVDKTHRLPACGTKGGVQPTATQLVVPVECSYQLAVVDVASGKTELTPAFSARAEVALIDGEVWVRWGSLGYLAKLDPDTGKLTTIDLNAGGPPLHSVYALVSGAGSVWVVGSPVEESPVRVLFRIDPETVTVTARAWTDGSMTILGDTGYAWDEQDRLSTFDPASVNASPPTEVVRPEVPSATQHEPRNAAERAVIATFSRVFDPAVSNRKAAPYLEDAAELRPVRTKLTTLARTLYESLRLVITEVSVTGDEASLAYTFLLNGAPAFVPLAGSLNRTGGKWVVSAESVCQLAVTAGVAKC